MENSFWTTKRILIMWSSIICLVIVLSTFIYSVIAMILYEGTVDVLITFQLEIYVPIFTTWTAFAIYECFLYNKKKSNDIINHALHISERRSNGNKSLNNKK